MFLSNPISMAFPSNCHARRLVVAFEAVCSIFLKVLWPLPVSGIKNEAPQKKLKESLPPVTKEEQKKIFDLAMNDRNSTVSIAVVGACGDLAIKRIFPALFALYYEDCLPEHFTIFGCARSKMTDDEFILQN